jgi:hypothetical protein
MATVAFSSQTGVVGDRRPFRKFVLRDQHRPRRTETLGRVAVPSRLPKQRPKRFQQQRPRTLDREPLRADPAGWILYGLNNSNPFNPFFNGPIAPRHKTNSGFGPFQPVPLRSAVGVALYSNGKVIGGLGSAATAPVPITPSLIGCGECRIRSDPRRRRTERHRQHPLRTGRSAAD